MGALIVHDSRPVTLVGGAKVKKSLLERAIVHGPKIVAADGAAEAVLAQGFLPEAVIGDFDSLGAAARARIPAQRQHLIEEQDSTDFEKCMARIDAPLVIGVGFTGGRLDHQLAVLHGLMHYAERPCLLLGAKDVLFLAPPRLRIVLPGGSRVSLFPMGPVAARSDGLNWPVEGLDFAPGRKIGTSNRVESGAEREVVLEADRPAMLIILPAARLEAALAALQDAATPRWAAR